MSNWLSIISVVSLITGAICFLIIAVYLIAGHGQKMWIMNAVWPITALYSGPFGLWAYFHIGRLSSKPAMQKAAQEDMPMPSKQKPHWQTVLLATTHCGAGCTLGDIIAEWLALAIPIVIFGHRLFGTWIWDYVFAFGFGIVFQYFTIVPMKNLSVWKGIAEALKADTLSLSAWQVGMYGWMAIATFAIFGRELGKTNPVFWFMMQIAMLAGLATAYPVNIWLLHKKIKEPM